MSGWASKLSGVYVFSSLQLSGYCCGSIVVRGCWPVFCGVIVTTQSCGGLCVVCLAVKHTLFSSFMFILWSMIVVRR